MKKRKGIALLLTVVMLVSLCLAACGSTTDDGVATNEEGSASTVDGEADSGEKKTKLVLAFDNFDSLDPFSASSSQIGLSYCVQSRLFCMDGETKEVTGDVAKEWTLQDDGVTYDITIYDYVKDSAGNPITAEDVVFSYESWIGSGVNSYAKYIESVEATGDYTLRLKLTTKDYGVLLTKTSTPIVNKAAYEADPESYVTNPIGCGPYVVKEFIPGTKAVFEKNENYWQTDESLVCFTGRTSADVIQFDVVAEETQRQTGIETGTVQYAKVMASVAEDLSASDVAYTVSRPATFAHGLMFNMYDSVFADNQALRQAVLYAIDNDAVAAAATYNMGSAAVTWGSSNDIGYQSTWENEDYYNRDVDKAKELLAEAGYEPGELTIRYLCNQSEYMNLAGQVIQANLADIGINLDIRSVDPQTYLANRAANSGEYDISFVDGNGHGYWAVTYMTYCDTSLYQYGNMFGTTDQKLQELMEEAIYSPSDSSLDAFQQYMKEQAYIYGLYVDYDYYALSNKVEKPAFGEGGSVCAGAFVLADDYDIYVE